MRIWLDGISLLGYGASLESRSMAPCSNSNIQSRYRARYLGSVFMFTSSSDDV